MKIAYFDCPSGISGNMILGALLDAGLDPNFLKREIGNLRMNFAVSNLKGETKRGNRDVQSQVSARYRLQIRKIKKHGISVTYFNVEIKEREKRRNLKYILSLINKSELSKNVKTLSSRIFRRLAAAEAKVHGVSINQVHFHEVGAVDAIIDIVGACIGIDYLGIEEIYCSPLPSGRGQIKHAHGVLPNPAPATVELLKGIPTYGTEIKAELVTPTGAAIISTLAKGFGNIPKLSVDKIGYGAGLFKLPIPNLLRIFIGEAELQTEHDVILQIETNIDDMDPKAFPKIITKLIRAGALDAYIIPILMKKDRQAFNLSVLCDPKIKDKILECIFTLTTTFGVRIYLVPREKLLRKQVRVNTRYGKARVKVGSIGSKTMTVAPEYEDYKRLAKKHHIPIQKAYEEIINHVY